MTSDEEDRIDDATRGKPELLHAENCDNWHESTYISNHSVLMNPDYDRKVFMARKKDLSKDAFDEVMLGKRVNKSGLVLRGFDREKSVRPHPSAEYIRGCRLGLGLDTGKYTGCNLVGIGRDGVGWVLGTYYAEELSTKEHAQGIRDMVLDVLCPVYNIQNPDDVDMTRKVFEAHFSDRIELPYIDSASQVKDDYAEELMCFMWEKYDLAPTLDRLDDSFKAFKLLISEDADDRLQWELSRYRWAPQKKTRMASESKAEQSTIKRNDHCIDGLRFVWMALEEMGALDTEPEAVTMSEAFDRQVHWEVVGAMIEQHVAHGLPDETQIFWDEEFMDAISA